MKTLLPRGRQGGTVSRDRIATSLSRRRRDFEAGNHSTVLTTLLVQRDASAIAAGTVVAADARDRTDPQTTTAMKKK
jgi:hypothetical protein